MALSRIFHGRLLASLTEKGMPRNHIRPFRVDLVIRENKGIYIYI